MDPRSSVEPFPSSRAVTHAGVIHAEAMRLILVTLVTAFDSCYITNRYIQH